MSAAAGSIRGGRPRGLWAGRVFLGFLLASLTIGFLARGAARAGLPRWLQVGRRRPLLRAAVGRPLIAGARPAILATIYLGIIIIALSVPLGVGTAIYLEEYANRDRWYNRMLEVNIQNLAAVPSIVYGILGLAFLVRGIGLGRVLLAGGMILTLLVLPTVIIAAREAIRAVPDSIRQGAYALGSTKWQVVWRQVFPAAIPGIATGSILALSPVGSARPRALLLVGALTYVSFNPTILGDFTALPVQIYQWIARPQEEFRTLAAARIIVLLAILLTLNAFAIWLETNTREGGDPISVKMADVSVNLAEQLRELPPRELREVVFDVDDLGVSYSGNKALQEVSLEIYKNFVTAFIGPSGCGKSTFIRCFNRMNDLIPTAGVEGTILYHGEDLYGPDVDPVEVRKRIGMVFQKPNPFPKSIYDNVAFGPRVLGMTDGLDDRVEGTPAGGTLGRGQGSAQSRRPEPVRRAAAAAVHRALSRGRA